MKIFDGLFLTNMIGFQGENIFEIKTKDKHYLIVYTNNWDKLIKDGHIEFDDYPTSLLGFPVNTFQLYTGIPVIENDELLLEILKEIFPIKPVEFRYA